MALSLVTPSLIAPSAGSLEPAAHLQAVPPGPPFDERYGPGARARVVRLLSQPCVSFARIAGVVGITRECVRLWHNTLLPEALTGRERQRLCRERRQRQALLRVGDSLVFLRVARVSRRSGADHTEYVLTPYRGPAELIYYKLSEDDFLLVPRNEVSTGGTMFVDGPSSRYRPYRNSFDALRRDLGRRRVRNGETPVLAAHGSR